MKRYYKVQLAVDVSLIVLGLLIAFFPHVSRINANVVFYTAMSVYAGLELLEYLLGRESKESLYFFVSSAVCAFSGFFLKNFSTRGVLSVTLAMWLLLISIIKIISLEGIPKDKARLFAIKLGSMSAILTTGILVCINIYFHVSETHYMLAFLYVGYGLIEGITDYIDFKSRKNYEE